MNAPLTGGHGRRRGLLLPLAWACCLLWLWTAPAAAAVVQRGFITLRDGTQLNYILTLPDASGKYPVALTYDPYAAGYNTGSDLPALGVADWNKAGYAHLGVNFRGTGCSSGTFEPLNAPQWGADGAEVVEWAAAQSWSTGKVGMFGFSFPGTSQLATAAYASPHLAAIAPWNVFDDFYRDFVYPGGILNSFVPLWVLVGRDYVAIGDGGIASVPAPQCELYPILNQPGDALQVIQVFAHPYDDSAWSQTPDSLLGRIHIPVLGCANWQDSTIYSRAFEIFTGNLPAASTWVYGSNGTHYDCAAPAALLLQFFDRYVKGEDNGWEGTPHVLLAHEVASGGKPAWTSGFATMASAAAAIQPLALHLHGNGLLDTTPATAQAADQYAYPGPTADTPEDWINIDHWQNAEPAGVRLAYTTPPLAADAEFFGSGSADLWMASTATDTDVQIALSEVRPDGQEQFVENGWLRLSHRKLDPAKSTALRPFLSEQPQDAAPLTPGQPVLGRIELLPFDHVFRAGSAIRLSIDAPGGWFLPLLLPATNSVYHQPGMDSQLVLGWLPGAAAQAPLPACGSLLNQPCRANATAAPSGTLRIAAAGQGAAGSSGGSGNGSGGGACSPWLALLLFAMRRRQQGRQRVRGGRV